MERVPTGQTQGALDEVLASLGWRPLAPFGVLVVGGLVAIGGAISTSPVVVITGGVLVLVGVAGVAAVSFVVARRSGRGYWRSLFFTVRSVLTAFLDFVPI